VKVLLRSDVKGVGRRGDIVEVKSGYARNYLLPTGAAIAATTTMADQASSMRKGRDLRDASSRAAAETQRAAIEAKAILITARAGTTGRLFGSVTEADVVAALQAATGVVLDKEQVVMAEHLKQVGPATVEAHLFEGVSATIAIEVVAAS
jgi:large subunit ribosomal protein L9